MCAALQQLVRQATSDMRSESSWGTTATAAQTRPQQPSQHHHTPIARAVDFRLAPVLRGPASRSNRDCPPQRAHPLRSVPMVSRADERPPPLEARTPYLTWYV